MSKSDQSKRELIIRATIFKINLQINILKDELKKKMSQVINSVYKK